MERPGRRQAGVTCQQEAVMARWPPFPAASFAALLLLASASCGTEPEPEPTFADIPVGTPFATTPAPVRERSALG